MDRSRKLTLTNWTKANDALNLHFEGNKSKLTKHLNMSRTTVTAFFKEEPIREAEFRKICLSLRLNWQDDSSVATNTKAANNDPLERVKLHCRKRILNLYSNIRLLSGQEIGVDQLYVDVWLLNRQPRTFMVSQDKMLATFDLRNDRLGLGDRIERNPGFEVASQQSRLLILGKPGSGKTTFLKHLAIDWCAGKFRPDLIAVFLEFRRIKDEKWKLLKQRKWSFLDAIGEELQIFDNDQVLSLLEDGKLMLLMDGFDEVPTEELRKAVQEKLKDLMGYSENRFIMTCRTQIIQGIPDGFTSVEVADFNSDQVHLFVRNWFWASTKNEETVEAKWQEFFNEITRNPALKELTTTPVLLGLMCLVLQDEGEIPGQASQLYEKGIRLLLQKWNEEKEITGWEIGVASYRELALEQKEQLLIEIAARKFENPKNFVILEEQELIKQIKAYLKLGSDDEARKVLEAIESQHGLLVERADELWSFSHLTFQEHFTTKWLLNLSPDELNQKIGNAQWQSVVNQLVKAQGQSDRLLRLIKRATDFSVSDDSRAQELLVWLLAKASSISTDQKPSEVRLGYFDHNLDLDLARPIARVLNLTLNDELALDHDLALALHHALALKFDHNLAIDRYRALTRAVDRVRARNSELTNTLEKLRAQLFQSSQTNHLEEWWNVNGQAWKEELRQEMIKHRNIGHDWQFTDDQRQTLENYGKANKFLVELLKIENSVSPEARQEIEDNLLLPIAELKRRLPDQYGGIEEG
jgi:predicted NACHT family NTPase